MQYSEKIFQILHPNEQYYSKFCRNITIQLTEDCNLSCTYCYQTHKTKKVMTFKTGKEIIDYLFFLYNEDNSQNFIDKTTEAIILDFIGGEPLLQIELMDQICDYFWTKAIEQQIPWAENWMCSLASNGLLYFSSEFQKFAEKYGKHISFTVSIDGDKETHDACRVDKDGNGSFDRAYAALRNWNDKMSVSYESKVTIAPENLPYIDRIFKFFYDEGFTHVNANPVYEVKWQSKDAQLYYSKLKGMADFMLSAERDFSSSLFVEDIQFRPLPSSENQNWCGGTGAMLAFDPDGKAYPCIRYMKSSLGECQPPIMVGDCWNGIYNTPETIKIQKLLDSITRRSQSTNECFYCPIAGGCAWCSAYNYQENGTPNKRSTNICWMHRARSLANVYYWNKYYQKNNITKVFPMCLDEPHALKIIDESELEILKKLEASNRKVIEAAGLEVDNFGYREFGSMG